MFFLLYFLENLTLTTSPCKRRTSLGSFLCPCFLASYKYLHAEQVPFLKEYLGVQRYPKMYLILLKHFLAVPWSQRAFGFCKPVKQWPPCMTYYNCSSHMEGEVWDVSCVYVVTLLCSKQVHQIANDDTEPTGNLCSSASAAGGQEIRTGSRRLLLGI